MLTSRGFAALALAATASSVTIVAPAEARAVVSAQYGWLNSCAKKEYTVPCGYWTLTLRGGKELKLKDATVYAKNGKGKIEKEISAPIALSGDGTSVGYFRKSDSKLVVRNLADGSVRALPGSAAKLPKGLGMNELDFTFSNDGDKVFIDYFDEATKLKSVLVDLETDQLVSIKGDETLQGFSPNGDYVLTSRYTPDNTAEFVVYDGEGQEVGSRVVPQVVSNNSPIALNDDGQTVALVITGPTSGAPARMRTYDLSTDIVSGAVKLDYSTTAENPSRLTWESGDGLTLWNTRTDSDGNVVAAVRRQVDPETGSAVKQESFKVKQGLWAWWLPGD